MSRNNSCSNFTINGCIGNVNKGSIMCEDCLEARKQISKNKKDDIEFLTNKNIELEKQLKEIHIEYKKNISEYEEISILQQFVEKQRDENRNLVKERGLYEMTYEQIKLDCEKLTIENQSIQELYTELLKENEKLTIENQRLQELCNEK
jgi:thioredoxin reductase